MDQLSVPNQDPNNSPCQTSSKCWSRRQFVVTGAASGATVLLGQLFPGRVRAEDASIRVSHVEFPRVPIARLSQLNDNQVVGFEYPPGALHGEAMLVKLGVAAGGGVGTDQDIVAFSKLCTHMGAALTYNAEHKLAGPCQSHLTSFDLTRHGMVAAGHASQALPQIVLEVEDDQVFATGIIGLLFGYHSNGETLEAGN